MFYSTFKLHDSPPLYPITCFGLIILQGPRDVFQELIYFICNFIFNRSLAQLKSLYLRSAVVIGLPNSIQESNAGLSPYQCKSARCKQRVEHANFLTIYMHIVNA